VRLCGAAYTYRCRSHPAAPRDVCRAPSMRSTAPCLAAATQKSSPRAEARPRSSFSMYWPREMPREWCGDCVPRGAKRRDRLFQTSRAPSTSVTVCRIAVGGPFLLFFDPVFCLHSACHARERCRGRRARGRQCGDRRARLCNRIQDSHRAHGTRGKRQSHSPDYQPNRRPPPQSESERGEPAAPTATRDAREQSPRPRLGDGEVIGEV
jgi:hypothetical protein